MLCFFGGPKASVLILHQCCGSRSKILNLKAIHNSGLLPEGREDGQRDELHLHRAQRLPGGDYNLPEAIRQAGDISPQATFIQENLRNREKLRK